MESDHPGEWNPGGRRAVVGDWGFSTCAEVISRKWDYWVIIPKPKTSECFDNTPRNLTWLCSWIPLRVSGRQSTIGIRTSTSLTLTMALHQAGHPLVPGNFFSSVRCLNEIIEWPRTVSKWLRREAVFFFVLKEITHQIEYRLIQLELYCLFLTVWKGQGVLNVFHGLQADSSTVWCAVKN